MTVHVLHWGIPDTTFVSGLVGVFEDRDDAIKHVASVAKEESWDLGEWDEFRPGRARITAAAKTGMGRAVKSFYLTADEVVASGETP